MPTNNSATGGYIAPAVSPAPLEGSALNAFVQAVIVGVTALPGPMVRPSWQSEPPNEPDFGTTWCAFRMPHKKRDSYVYIEHDPAGGTGDDTGDGADNMFTHQDIDILTSFYSDTQDNADQYTDVLADGLQIPQNREQLQLAGWMLTSISDSIAVPSLVKQRWLYRTDMTIQFRRGVSRTYPVLNLLSAQVGIVVDQPPLNIPVNVTGP